MGSVRIEGRAGLLGGLFLAALTLRPQLVGIGPLLPRVERDLGVSHAVAGLLASVPVLCMGLFAPPAAYLVARIGTRRAIASCLGLIATAGLARALAPDPISVVVLTLPIGVGMGLAGAILPVMVKERFADRPASATGIYAAGINVGSALAAALAVPLAVLAGGWRGTLLIFSSLTGALGVGWLTLTRGQEAHVRPEIRPPRLPLRSGIGWALVLVFALMSTSFYGLNSWLPDAYVERGWSESSAGSLLAVLNIASIPGAVLVPWLADRLGSRRRYLVGSSALFAGGVIGLTLIPAAGWAFAAIAGLAVGALFPLVLTLPLDVAASAAEVGALVGLMLGAGYSISALSPFLLGAVRDLSGSFSATLWIDAGVTLALVLACLPFSRVRLQHRTQADGAS
jgi:CP family cyanate transporter-like MFS transporter